MNGLLARSSCGVRVSGPYTQTTPTRVTWTYHRHGLPKILGCRTAFVCRCAHADTNDRYVHLRATVPRASVCSTPHGPPAETIRTISPRSVPTPQSKHRPCPKSAEEYIEALERLIADDRQYLLQTLRAAQASMDKETAHLPPDTLQATRVILRGLATQIEAAQPETNDAVHKASESHGSNQAPRWV